MSEQIVKVTRDLREIETLHEALLVQAIHKANDRLMPGGEAMVALAHVASPEEWAENVAAAEFHHYATCTKLDHTRCQFTAAEDEEDTEPPLQTLLFWSEQWRAEHGYPLERRPTVTTEAKFLRWALDWAWSNLVEWKDFAEDVRTVRARLENLLLAGARTEFGVPCLSCVPAVDLTRLAVERHRDCDCGPRPTLKHAEHARCDCPFWLRLVESVRPDGEVETVTVRVYDKEPLPEGHVHPRPDLACVACRRETEWDESHAAHDRGGLRDEWKCPSCERRYDEETYRRAVAHAAFVSAEWLPLEDAMARTGAKRGSIQGWATKGDVKKRRDADSGRMTYNVRDIEAKVGEPNEAA